MTRRLIPIFLCLPILFSCEREEVKTPGEKLSARIAALTADAGVTKADLYMQTYQYGYVQIVDDQPFVMEGQYVKISGSPTQYYTMERLTSFKIENLTLVLLFD
jgi:hypothetical protein